MKSEIKFSRVVETDFSKIEKQGSVFDKIQEKLKDMQTSVKTIDKVFTFSMENLQDNPNKCLSEIKDYLEEHADKIEDYWFTSHIDQHSFKPILTMHVIPVESIAKSLKDDHWTSLAKADLTVEKMESDIREIFSHYLFEFNNKETRQSIVENVSSYFSHLTEDKFKVKDETTPEVVDSGGCIFVVDRGGKEFTISEYIEYLYDNNLLLNRPHHI